ncbi:MULTISPECIES: presqualene diphosphate synthase HpnD [Caballeronia]|uniref:Phytoene synthase n=1 Tax=Caballeronia grimmiae TaxID=1071679 RepID=A0A069P475_9BURK|nr:MULTISPECIES: presqualene diphosphate synthase HpnD [Caballeronia]KDR35403.1 phytoene synthase [Caballeronia grimmiae]MDR5734983.1 presqualene diphosphate synthase HpnD [Caballeronia sp. LZ025]GGD84975.1 squalene synthase HpnD [Caballeronia grimmiae]
MAVSNIIADESTTDAAKASSGSSFYLAMRILPAAQRDAMYQIYAFCRAVDDIADEGSLPRRERALALERWREDIDACYRGAPPRSLEPLTRHIHAFQLSRDDFQAVIDGMAMDAACDIVAPDEATLDLYCDRVASAVGRLSVRIFGMHEDAGRRLAHHLGRALQLTNILRDIDEDAAIGRVYLPRELLAREGISTSDPATIVGDARLPRVCAVLAERAKGHYAQSDIIMAASPRHEVRAPRIMSAAYRTVLDANLKRGFDLPRTRVRTPRARLLWIVARNLL